MPFPPVISCERSATGPAGRGVVRSIDPVGNGPAVDDVSGASDEPLAQAVASTATMATASMPRRLRRAVRSARRGRKGPGSGESLVVKYYPPVGTVRWGEMPFAHESTARETELMVSWLFRNRTTGHITLAQPPNLSLIIFTLLAVARWLFAPAGVAGAVVGGAAGVALAWWSIDELIRGVNPFRRMLGAGVLAWTLVSTGRVIF